MLVATYPHYSNQHLQTMLHCGKYKEIQCLRSFSGMVNCFYVETTSVILEMRRRIVAKHKNKTNKEENETQDLTRFDNLPYVLG